VPFAWARGGETHSDELTSIMAVGPNGQVYLREVSLESSNETSPVGIIPPGIGQRALAATEYDGVKALLIGGRDGALELVDAKSGLPLIDSEPVNSSAATIVQCNGRNTVVTGSGGCKLVCRDLATGSIVAPPVPVVGQLKALRTVTSEGRDIVVGTSYIGVKAWYGDDMSFIRMHWKAKRGCRLPSDSPRRRARGL
jgi:hypothetical protein